ncbi:MAG: hypothetical protein AB1589_41795 [Cyanobacteriota bacterium]
MPVLETAPELKLSVAEISNLTEQLQEYCAIYNPLFRRAEQREYAGDYVHGLLLDLPRKSVEPMVLTLYGIASNCSVWAIMRCGRASGWHHHMIFVMLAHHFLVRLLSRVKKKSLR